jgi:uncharacterized protein
MLRRALALVLVLVVVAGAAAQDGKDARDVKTKKARKFLQLSSQPELLKLQLAQMTEQLSKNPRITPAFMDKWKELATPEDMLEAIVPVYEKHFDESDLDALIAFYETPVGRKLAEKNAAIFKDTSAAGQKWVQDVNARVVKALKD